MKTYKIGLIVGTFFGMMHLFWSILVAVEFAQPLSDFIYWAHFFNNPFIVAPFNLGTAFVLVIVTFCVGYIFGSLIGWLRNKFHRVTLSA